MEAIYQLTKFQLLTPTNKQILNQTLFCPQQLSKIDVNLVVTFLKIITILHMSTLTECCFSKVCSLSSIQFKSYDKKASLVAEFAVFAGNTVRS